MASPPSTSSIKGETLSQQPHQSPISGDDNLSLVSDDEINGDPLDDEDLGDDISNYNESAEPFPKAVVYDPDFKKVHEDTLRLMGEVANIVPEESRELTRTRHLVVRSRELAEFPITRKRLINMVGKSGSGKSSLLNSMIGMPGHAKAIAGSKACTHVPTTYESAFKDQKKRFGVMVEFFCREQIRNMIEHAVSDYYKWADGGHDDLEEGEAVKLQRAADTALKTFRTLFGRKNGFATVRNIEDFLATASGMGNTSHVIVNKFVSWCSELIAESGVDHGSLYQTDDESELRDYIHRFAFSSVNPENPSLWPLVKFIREGISGVDILKYVSFVDWPGSDDTNNLRAMASAQRIYDCDEIWIVSSANRISTDTVVAINLVRYGRTIPCVLICTAIDDNLNKDLVREMENSECDVGNYWELSEAIENMQKEIQPLKRREEKLEQALSRGWVQTKSNKRQRLDQDTRAKYQKERDEKLARISESEAKQGQLEQTQLELAVQVRQTYVLRLITDENLQRHIPNGHLRVMFASNTHYTRHKPGNLEKGATLSPDVTGIPNIRQHVLKSAAPKELQIVKNYINNDVKLLINGIGLVTNTVDPQGCEDALKIVERRQDEVDHRRRFILHTLDSYVRDRMVSPLASRQEDHSRSALKVLDRKRTWAWGSIRAFVDHHGRHKTKSKEYHSWAEQFMHEAAGDVTGLWNSFMHAEHVARDIKGTLIDEFKAIVEALNRHESSFRIQQDDFQQFIEGQIGRVAVSCAEFEEDFTQALR